MTSTLKTTTDLDRVCIPLEQLRAYVREGRRVRIELCNVPCKVNGRPSTIGGYAVVVGPTETVNYASAIAARFIHRADAVAFLDQAIVGAL